MPITYIQYGEISTEISVETYWDSTTKMPTAKSNKARLVLIKSQIGSPEFSRLSTVGPG